MDRELLDLIVALDGDQSRLSTLSDNSNTLALAVLLGEVGEVLDDILGLLGGQVVGLSIGLGLGLVTDDVVPVRGAGVDDVLEELADEGSREGQDEGLVVGSGLLGELHDGRGADGEVVAADVVGLGVLDEAPDLRLLQMLEVVVVGGAKVGAETPVVTGDDNAATTGLFLGIDAVLDAETGGLNGIVKNGRVLVVAGAADVDDAVRGEDVLGTTGRVLGSSAGDELGVVVVEEVLEQGEVLLVGEDSVVGLELVLVKKSLVTLSLDVFLQHRKVSNGFV